MKKLFSLILAILILSILALPVLATDVDIDEYIEDYVPDSFNDVTLEIGEKATAEGSLWLDSGLGQAISSDEDVVTVSKKGTVTAVGEGEAYVVVISSLGLSKVTRYTVVEHKSIFTDNPMGLVLLAPLLIFVAVVVFGIVAVKVRSKAALQKLYDAVQQNPCQQTADQLLKKLNTCRSLKGINPDSWRFLYNGFILTSPATSSQTKSALAQKLTELGVSGLTFTAQPTPAPQQQSQQSKQEKNITITISNQDE